MSPTETSSFTVRDAFYEVLRAFGVDTIFGNPGSTELPMFRDFPQDFRYVLGLQEAVVAGMADGFSQGSGQLAVMNLHSAAGVGNAMGNIYTAYKNRSPLLIVAGQQARSILPYEAYLASDDPTQLVRPYVKWAIEPARAADVPHAIATASHMALQGPRGPVLVSVPSDDWDQPAGPFNIEAMSYQNPPPQDALAALAAALEQAQQPALVVGAEVDRSGAWREIVALAERAQASVWAAPMSARCSFPEDHPLFMGFLPAAREPIVNQLTPHDLVVVIGAPVFTYHIEGHGPFAPPEATLFQLTEDSLTAARSAAGRAIVGNVKLGLQALLCFPLSAKKQPARQRPPITPAQPSTPLNAAYVLQTLSQLRQPEDIIVEEAPTARVIMHDYLPMVRPQTFYTMASGGLGYSIAAAVGVALARPKQKVIALIGDGSTMYSLQALWTAVRLGLNITFVILNNQRYAAMDRFGRVLGFPADTELPGVDISGLDFVGLAQAQGCTASLVQTADELTEQLQSALAVQGPHLLEVRIA